MDVPWDTLMFLTSKKGMSPPGKWFEVEGVERSVTRGGGGCMVLPPFLSMVRHEKGKGKYFSNILQKALKLNNGFSNL